jgi:ferritin-like metal-binding protein YciE
MTKKELYKNDLKHLFKSDLKHIYYVEKEHSRVLRQIIKVTTDPDIKQEVQTVLDQSAKNMERIENVFDNLGLKPRSRKSRGIEGMIKESKEIIMKAEHLTYVMIDAALLSAIHRILFYKIASYKIIKGYAKLMADKKSVELFDGCLKDAVQSERKLSRLIISRVKPETVTVV